MTFLGRAVVALGLPVVCLLLWQIAVSGQRYSLIPPPTEVAMQWWDMLVGGVWDDAYSATMLEHAWASMYRVFGGFGLAAAAGIPLGLLLGRVDLVRRIVDPTLQILRPIPVTAWLPLALILFGIGPKSAFFLVFLGAFWPILLNTVFGVRNADPRLTEAAAMLGVGKTAMFRKVVLPAALPSIFTGLRLSLGISWVVIVIGEMTGVRTGLGAVIMEARQLSRTAVVLSGMVTIGALGFFSDYALLLIGRRLLRWKDGND
ncbi:ABC transporter permease [Hwanghaeella grinnelliae]|uniref:ABC transporter permease n=1 Tax=Hwanghaeella grinnelliae TaxID=2500179 RepID=A0A437QZ82_9PROT|nr:ABC transporter permease [Hwanghaeella grinnelliae]RVU39826.1 ABC transporter permease [Hwanghaeella grinnelliae]